MRSEKNQRTTLLPVFAYDGLHIQAWDVGIIVQWYQYMTEPLPIRSQLSM